MSPAEILEYAVRRAKCAREIPIQQIVESVPVPVFFRETKPFKEPIEQYEPPKFPTMKTIIREVADHYGLTIIDMISLRRERRVCQPRQVCMYLARILTPRTFPEIGRLMGGRDHTTTLYGYRTILKRMETDPKLCADIEQLKLKLAPTV